MFPPPTKQSRLIGLAIKPAGVASRVAGPLGSVGVLGVVGIIGVVGVVGVVDVVGDDFIGARVWRVVALSWPR
jgi:hypothetical protein